MRSRMLLVPSAAVAVTGLGLVFPAAASHAPAPRWKVSGQARPASIKGGPWTLGQGPATLGSVTNGYCDASGKVRRNPGKQLFQPAYFPAVTGHGKHLTGLFDYRPKDTDEAVLAADSGDGGRTWTFRSQALESNKGQCPSGTLNDDGQGHPTVLNVRGHQYLYTLSRPTADTPGSQLIVHTLRGGSLDGLPSAQPVGTGATTTVTTAVTLPQATVNVGSTAGFEIPGTVRIATSHGVVDVRCSDATATAFTGCVGGTGTVAAGAHVSTYAVTPSGASATTGLLSPDGILGVLPGKAKGEVTILYVQKQKDHFTSLTQKGACAVPYDTLAKIGEGKKKDPLAGNNEDLATVRTASTRDGIHFTDHGAVSGLGDPTDPSATATRFVSPSGTVVRYHDGSYGLFFGAGNCYDGDSDGFHYIGYADSKDGVHWHVVNGFTNPLLSTDSAFPSSFPRAYYTGRIYAPQVILENGGRKATLVFAGYRTPKPLPKPGTVLGTNPAALYTVQATDLASYRTILTISLSRTN